MKSEFVRYGLTSYLKLVGTLQILGAIGLLAGYYYEPILAISSEIGLAVLMIFGYGVRRKIKDNFLQSAPSFIYAIFNIYLAYAYQLQKHLLQYKMQFNMLWNYEIKEFPI